MQAIVAFSAVGSLREEIKPRDLVLPDQIIDRTKVRYLLPQRVFASSTPLLGWLEAQPVDQLAHT